MMGRAKTASSNKDATVTVELEVHLDRRVSSTRLS